MKVDNRPYSEILYKDSIIRIFSNSELSDEFKWHRDEKDRKIFIISGDKWFYQFDDSIPLELKPGDVFLIPHNKWHRIIPGSNDLVIKIIEGSEKK